MKPLWYASLLLLFLSLAFVGTEPRPALGASGIQLQPGKYTGPFNIEARIVVMQNMPGQVKADWSWSERLLMDGTVIVEVSAPNEAIARLNQESLTLYEIRNVQLSGAVNCGIFGMMSADAQALMLAPLSSNYDPEKSAFGISITIFDITNHRYHDNRTGDSRACSQQISRQTLTKAIDYFTGEIEKAELIVNYATDKSMGGEISIPGWDDSTPIQYGQMTRTTLGVWNAFLKSDKPSGQKRWKQ